MIPGDVRVMSKLVWLFSDYRDAVQRIYQLEQEILKQRMTIEQLEKLEKYEKLDRTVPTSVDSLLKEFQDMILAEQPYPDGKIPESAYLTPGE